MVSGMSTAREKLMKARAEIAKLRGIPEAEVPGWEAGFLAWSFVPEDEPAPTMQEES
jgi:hypothetical protein